MIIKVVVGVVVVDIEVKINVNVMLELENGLYFEDILFGFGINSIVINIKDIVFRVFSNVIIEIFLFIFFIFLIVNLLLIEKVINVSVSLLIKLKIFWLLFVIKFL